MDDVKKYDSTSPLFAYIPKEVRKVLLHDFEDLLTDDFCTITKYDKLDPPEGIPLTTKYQQNEPLPPTVNPPDDLEDTQYLENLEREFILDSSSVFSSGPFDVIRGSRRWLIIAGQENKAFAAQSFYNKPLFKVAYGKYNIS